MKKTTLAILTALVTGAASLPLLADSAYQYENSVQYAQGDTDSQYVDDYSNRQLLLAGVTYFNKVVGARGPLAESAFLERASGFRLAFSRRDLEYISGATSFDTDIEQRQYSAVANLEYYIPNSMFFVSVGAVGLKYEVEYRSLYEDIPASKDKGSWDYKWTAALGLTPADGLLIWSNFYEDQNLSDYWNLSGKYVVLLQNDRAINIQLSYAQSDEEGFSSSAQSISADYYFNPSFSLGAAYNLTDNDFAPDYDSSELRVRKFFGDRISVSASYVKMDYEDVGALGGSFRF